MGSHSWRAYTRRPSIASTTMGRTDQRPTIFDPSARCQIRRTHQSFEPNLPTQGEFQMRMVLVVASAFLLTSCNPAYQRPTRADSSPVRFLAQQHKGFGSAVAFYA